MNKFIENMLFGLAFGIGFCVAQGVLAFIVSILARGVNMPH